MLALSPRWSLGRRRRGLTNLLASVTAKATASCTAPALTSPFASLGDANQYALLPGESADNFTATGWLLGGGAKVVTTKLADGTTGSVLDLPAGAYAISPGRVSRTPTRPRG